jgi:hypothetical protein
MAALSPVIGYDKASAIARNASHESTTLRQAALPTTESAGRARRAENRSGGRSPLHRPVRVRPGRVGGAAVRAQQFGDSRGAQCDAAAHVREAGVQFETRA